LERGCQLSVQAIAAEVGVSHTTLLNRFGSKEALLVAALSPPEVASWEAELKDGPDGRPFRVQLEALCLKMAEHLEDAVAGMAALHAAGIDRNMARGPLRSRQQAIQALHDWLEQAQAKQLIGPCDTCALATILMGTLTGRAMTLRMMSALGESAPPMSQFVSDSVEILWNGIAPKE
jgi:AcrR family transcriptional regulator